MDYGISSGECEPKKHTYRTHTWEASAVIVASCLTWNGFHRLRGYEVGRDSRRAVGEGRA